MAENDLKSRRNKSFLDGTGKICYRGGEVINMTIPQNLKDLRRLSGMTQEQVAEKVGLTRQAISSYESGRTQPDLEMLARLAEVYGAEITDVLYGTGPRQKALRFWRRAPFVLAAAVLAVMLLRSALLLGLNTFLTFPSGMAVTEAVRPLMERRFALLDVVQILGGLAETVSLLGCLVLGVLLFFAKLLPPVRRGLLFFLTLAGGLLLVTIPLAALDGTYQIADYLWPGLNILPPVVLLLLWWGILALVRRKKDRSAL